MYTIYVKFTCAAGKREEFVEGLKEAGIVDAIRAEDGCIQYDYYYSRARRAPSPRATCKARRAYGRFA